MTRATVLLGLLLAVAGCGDRRAVSEREDVPPQAVVVLEEPPGSGSLPDDLKGTEVKARLDARDAGAKSYWLQIDWTSHGEGGITNWGFVVRSPTIRQFELHLGRPRGGPGKWENHPFRYELSAGAEYSLELRSLYCGKPADPECKLHCPTRPLTCPHLKTIRVDLRGFR